MKVIIDPLKDIEIVWSVDGEYLRPMYAVDKLRYAGKSKWESAPKGIHDSPHVRCGNCGEDFFEYFKKFPYCPMCGKLMETADE